jgi:predicted transposase YbfD/YdcC
MTPESLADPIGFELRVIRSGAESWNDIADYGEDKREWLQTFLTLPSGIPSHDTFNRVFAAMDPEEMERGFAGWVSSIAKLTAGEVVAIDGKTGVPCDRSSSLVWKTLCGTPGTLWVAGKKALVHMVSAWASANNLVLGQRKVDEESNEITAIPKLLNALELAGTVVTVAAMGCQREIAGLIVAKKADYVLAVKDNQGLLTEQVRDSFLLLASDAVSEDIDCGHGRVEQRRCSVIADLSMVDKAAELASLQGLVRIESERYHKATGKTEREIRYYITSLRPDAAKLNSVIRQHWGIENPPRRTLGARRGLWRRSGPKASRPCGAKILAAEPHCPQLAQAGHHFQTRHQGKETQSRMEPPLPVQTTGDLICVGPAATRS